MRELIKSMMSFSWAMSLFGARQVGSAMNLSTPGASQKASDAFDSVAHAAEQELGDLTRSAFVAGDRMQRTVVDAMFGVPPSRPGGPPPSPALPQTRSVPRPDSGRLNAGTFVVLGEGLAAGMGDFSLSQETQPFCFPALAAGQMQVPFPQRFVQPPGIGDAVGFASLSVRIPAVAQTTVVESVAEPVYNLSVPGFHVKDAIHYRPVQPLVDRGDSKQTAANLILGLSRIVNGQTSPNPTQLETAVQLRPTLALVALGYQEALEASIHGDPGRFPDAVAFREHFGRIVRELRSAGAEVVLATVPDPFDTAHFADLPTASRIAKVDDAVLRDLFHVPPDAFLTLNGLNEISFQIFGGGIQPLPQGSFIGAEVARRLRAQVADSNAAIASVAHETGAQVFDLSGLLHSIRERGVQISGRTLTGDYLGGFYTLNGYYPGATGHAVIANEFLGFLNRTYGSQFPSGDTSAVMAVDPAAGCLPAEGPNWKLSDLASLPHRPLEPAPPLRSKTAAPKTSANGWRQPPLERPRPALPLKLPPGLEQVLPLSHAGSYFGDGIGAVNCQDPREAQYGSCGGYLFGGLAMVDSHLRGNVRIRFSPAVNNVTKFEISFEGGFLGDDTVLVTPQFFKMAFQQPAVIQPPGVISSGYLNLADGGVQDLTVNAIYSATALLALVSVNPNFPNPPIIRFRGDYGLSEPNLYASASAAFEQRPDGLLDFTFYGSAFIPLGPGTRWPLNFAGPSRQFATIPSSGTVMHPHLRLSTKDPVPPDNSDVVPEIPYNSIQEYTLFTHNSSFGDAFTLNTPELVGGATGRSQLLGRMQVQFGIPSGNTVPMAVFTLGPGGIMGAAERSPISEIFPGRLTPGAHGFNEFLRFPLRTYPLDELSLITDPFDLPIAAVDLPSGRTLNDLLHRAFISQDLIFALLRVEPNTPKTSFYFRGPALLRKGTHGQTVLRFAGTLSIPYPEGFLFPQPDFATGFVSGPGSHLDPFYYAHALGTHQQHTDAFKTGSAEDIVSSVGDRFSYRYEIPADCSSRRPVFEYTNHSQGGTFRMHSLAWVGFSNSGSSPTHNGDYDTVTFAGYGIWTKDGISQLQQAAAQFCTSPAASFTGIQIGQAAVSNVNTKPKELKDALP